MAQSHKSNGGPQMLDNTSTIAVATERPANVAPAHETLDRPGGLDIGASPLSLDGWLEYNQQRWNVTPHHIRYQGGSSGQPAIEAIVYLNQRGQVYHPPGNPYIPIRFESTPAKLRHRLTRQWLEMSGQLAAEMRHRGLLNTLSLPPEVSDVRAWQWAGYRAAVRYTLFIDFPFQLELADQAIRRSARKAERSGYRCARTTNMAEVEACLTETEQRQRFDLRLSQKDLELAERLLGETHFRAYVCYAPNGEPASTSVVLHAPGAPAIGWLRGTRTAHLTDGATQLLEFDIVNDLEAGGASSYDLMGANTRSVANAKSTWGARLQPYYTIEGYSVRRLAKWALNWRDFLVKGDAS